MAKLSREDQSIFDKLKKKMEEPDVQPTTRSVRANIDLGDPAQIKLAKKLGFLPADDDDDDDKSDDKDDDDKDQVPRRRGYFPPPSDK